MTTKRFLIIAAILLALAILNSVLYAPELPDRVPTHWNINGEVDGWGSRTTGLVLVPAMMVGFLLLMLILPVISPRRFRIEGFRDAYYWAIILLLALFDFIHALTLYAATHPLLRVDKALIAGICIALAGLGLLMPRVKRNFWMGFRTPWTLANERVWTETHRLGGLMMLLGGILGALLVLAGVHPVVSFGVVIAATMLPVVYSLWLYRKLEREEKLEEEE